MSASKMIRPLFVAIAIFSLQSVLADPPSGTVTIPVDASIAPVYDLNGDLTIQQPMQGAGGTDIALNFTVSMIHEGNGRLHGTGLTQLSINENFVAADYTVTGTISGGGDNTKVNLSIQLSGQDVIENVDTPFNIQITYKLKVDPETLAFVGTSRGSAKFIKLKGKGTIKSDVSIPLPANADGSWSIQLNILPLSGLVGTGNYVLPNRTLPSNLTGSFSEKSNLTKVKLVGFNEGKGSTVNVNLTPVEDVFDIDTLKGKVLGQSVRK